MSQIPLQVLVDDMVAYDQLPEKVRLRLKDYAVGPESCQNLLRMKNWGVSESQMLAFIDGLIKAGKLV